MIISELCEELQTAPNDVKKALKEYQVILASTVQQADSKQIMKLKEDPDSQYFNTIIVEEAARANPLDLLIPMAKAERRIILVGDHRQLPHLLEPAVEKAIQESADNDLKTRYQESLFGRLVEYFREREKTDHIPRVVMLDTQYRMHPFLGKFISRTFYESQGDIPIKSVKPEDIFEHGVSTYQGKVVVWINIPPNEGEETRGQSKSRPVEARRIAQEVKKILEENPELSIGMIAFYAAQVNELWKALRHADMAELDDEKDYIFSQRWRDAKHERFIGTVDASQGKEFDVVFLSMTRSNKISLSDDQRTWNQKFGFLRLENRLNVAMSRAKKLLFVVGDDRMFLTKEGNVNPLAQAAVPGLYAFWEATDNQGIAVPVENKGKKYGIRI